MKPRDRTHLWAAAVAVVMAACSGGGSEPGINGGGVGGINGGGVQGINGGGVALGPITGFGSVLVNGIQFATGGSSITIDGVAASESQLQAGHIVEIRGTLNSNSGSGTAISIAASDQLEGPVEAISVAASTFQVLGITVRVTGATLFDHRFANPTVAGLAGQWVEVSGLRNGAGEVVATRIEPRAPGGEIELNGVVANLDTAARTFRLGNATVNYTNAASVQGNLVNNACVEVKGTTFSGTTLNANRVEVKNCTVQVANNDVGSVQGFITRFTSATDFDVGAQRVTTTNNTVYEDGTAADLALNRRIEVEGTFNANGVLIAVKVRFKRDTSVRFAGTIEQLSGTNRTLTIFGVTIAVNNSTAFEDKSAARVRPFGFADLRSGDYLELRGSEGATPLTATAALIERRDPAARRELQAIARDVASPNFTLVGVTVVTSA
ncbi:MAG: DUF5666 domain-containing protein, partial [Steroidobacteraceae bacterium]|nr:DUF5666 domain-containing protein [Steroidobacteraceae bacterium]